MVLPHPWNVARFNWWIRGCCLLYLICVDESPAGFGMCLRNGVFVEEIDYELMDFYISQSIVSRVWEGKPPSPSLTVSGRWTGLSTGTDLRALTFLHRL